MVITLEQPRIFSDMKINKTKFSKLNNCHRGFVALLFVTTIGFLAMIFLAVSAPQSWLQSKGVAEARSATVARFAAISCLNIAKLKIFNEENSAEEEIEGEYFVDDGHCLIEEVEQEGNTLFLKTSATVGGIKISLESEYDI